MCRTLPLLVLILLSSCDCGVEPLAPLPGRVAGIICNADDGLPAAAVPVELVPTRGDSAQTETDAGGNFLIDRVPSGPASLVVGERTLDVVVESDRTTTILDPACRDVPPGPGFGDIVGTICNRHTGQLIQNATVSVLVNDQTLQTTTDEDGRFQLWNVPTGERIVVVSGEGFQRSWAVTVVEGAAVAIPSDDECRLPTADEGMLSGVFCDPESGGFLTGALVTVTDSDSRRHIELTDTGGAFLLGPLVPGPAQLRVEKGSFVLDVTAVIVAGAEAQVTNGGGCVDETCAETLVESDNDGRIELILVVDRSGSMTSGAPGYASTRWAGVVASIESVTAQLQSRVAFGLALFPAMESNECGTASLYVEPAFDNAPAIASLLDDFYTEPVGATPTAAALDAVRAWHADHPPERPRVVLLATDGGPNCNASLDPYSCDCSSGDASCTEYGEALLCLDDDNAVGAVAALRELELDTYIIGIPGVENFGYVLDRMADAGGTGRYFMARDIPALEAAVGEIGRRAGGCSVEVAEDLSSAARVDVAMGGESVPRDSSHGDGFDVVDAHHVELYGSACEAWLTLGAATLGICTLAGGAP